MKKIWEKVKEFSRNATLTKFVDFFAVLVWFFATLCGTAYLFYYRELFPAVANIILALLALPEVARRIKALR